jgi:S-adenosylmethionine hydrolase
MILLFTDFGWRGPYIGEVEAVLRRAALATPIVHLMADAPAFNPRAAAYLLAALAERAEADDVILAVVDPGVGGPRQPLAVEADGRWLVGPDNGLFELLLRRATTWRGHRIDWRPPTLSSTFHGRDLFAPVTARLATGSRDGLAPADPTHFPDWPDDLAEVIYIDGYGNAMTGLRASGLAGGTTLTVAGHQLHRQTTFSTAAPDKPFWYANSSGLVELALDRASIAAVLGLTIGTPVGLR